MNYPKDYLEACKRAGTDPKQCKTPEQVESYMKAWNRVGESLRKRKQK